MEGKFKILGVVEPKNTKRKDKNNFQFRIQLDSGEEAYMRYDLAKKKYAPIFFDYFLENARKIYNNEELKDEEEDDAKKQFCQKNEPHENAGSHVSASLNECENGSHEKAKGLLDYDIMVPIDSAIAYPVYFKFSKETMRCRNKRVIKNGVKSWKHK